jgi:hypothetical protein
MSAPTIVTGHTWANGETVTPTRLNDTLNDATLNFTQSDVVAGRATAGAGAAEEIACTAVARTFLAASSTAAQRTAVGAGTLAVQNANAVALTGGSAILDYYATNPATISYGATVTLDFSSSAATSQILALTGNVTLATSNLVNGRCKMLRIGCDGTARSLTFPAGWVFVGGAAPALIAANKVAILTILSFGTANSDVVASYSAQP